MEKVGFEKLIVPNIHEIKIVMSKTSIVNQ